MGATKKRRTRLTKEAEVETIIKKVIRKAKIIKINLLIRTITKTKIIIRTKMERKNK